jgi:hypothetical protein
VEKLVQRKVSRRSRLVSTISAIGGTVVAVMVLWGSGIRPSDFWNSNDSKKKTLLSRSPVQAPPPAQAVALIPMRPTGNDSSLSLVPLPIFLVRVQLGTTYREGTAEIGVAKDSPQTYSAGAILENGARLTEIHPDYVVLEKDAHADRLYLNADGRQAQIASKTLSVGGVLETPRSAKVSSEEELTNYIRPSPLYDGPSFIGYQVYPGSNRVPFSRMGLEPGDVIVELNGVPLGHSDQAIQLLHELIDGNVLSATVKRQEQFQAVTLDGRMILDDAENQKAATRQMVNLTGQ